MRKRFIIILLTIFLCGCDLLIKDEKRTGINYIPLAFNVQSINYTKNYDSDDVVTNLSQIDGSQYKLNIYAPLTDSKDVNVKKIQISENIINVLVSASKEKVDTVRRPLISIIVSGLNPYIEDKYSVKINPLYPALNPSLEQDEAIKILKSNIDNNINSPIFSKIVYKNKKLTWNLGFYGIDNDNKNIFYKNISIDDTSKKIISNSKKIMSKKILNGKILGILNKTNIIYINDNFIYSYYIPTKSTKRLDINLTTFKFHKTDSKNNSIFIFANNTLYKLDKDFYLKKLFKTDLNVKDIAIGEKEIFLLTDENKIYSWKNEKIEKIFSSNDLITSIEYSDTLYISTQNAKSKSISKINNIRQFIDSGESIKTLDGSLFYLKNRDNLNNLMLYDIESGLKINLYSAEKLEIEKECVDSFIFYEKTNNCKNVYNIKNESISFITTLPSGQLYKLSDQNAIINIEGEIYKLDIKAQN